MEIIVSSLSDLTHPLRFVALCVGRRQARCPAHAPPAQPRSAEPVKGGGFNLGFRDGGYEAASESVTAKLGGVESRTSSIRSKIYLEVLEVFLRAILAKPIAKISFSGHPELTVHCIRNYGLEFSSHMAALRYVRCQCRINARSMLPCPYM